MTTDETSNRGRVGSARMFVNRKYKSLELAIKAEAIAELIRAMAMSENKVLTYEELVEYHNKLREEAKLLEHKG